jgi:membrane-associated phospholipid phosphatase
MSRGRALLAQGTSSRHRSLMTRSSERRRISASIPWAGVALGAFTAVLALVRARRLDALDLAFTVRIQAVRHPRLARLMSVVSWPGFPPQSRVLPPLVVASLWLKGRRPEATTQLLAWGSALVSTLVKAFMRRPRPVAGTDLRVVAAPLGGSSFPSGHVLTYVGTYGWLAVLAGGLIRRRWPRRLAVGSLLGMIAAVGPSRIYLGHHWMSDVVGSYLLGSAYVLGVGRVYRRLLEGRTMADAD